MDELSRGEPRELNNPPNAAPAAPLGIIAAIRRIRWLYKLQWRLRQSFYLLQWRMLVSRPVVSCAPLLEDAILRKLPLAAGKMGSTEAAALNMRLRRQKAKQSGKLFEKSYSPWIMHTLFVNSGVFPQRAEVFDKFGDIYFDAVKRCDLLVSWNVAGEAQIFRDHCQSTTFVEMKSLEPYFCDPPWSRQLARKRVLVISPFADSIERQYLKRDTLWRNPDVLPQFDLLTIRAPLSAGLVAPDSSDWFAALAQIKEQMDLVKYDVVLIGAGAFSLPLAVHAKDQGKIGIHLGGGLQILFGIIGARWESKEEFRPFINSSWRRPSAEETPKNASRNEDGCYW